MSLFGGIILNQARWINPKNVMLDSVISPAPPGDCFLAIPGGLLLNPTGGYVYVPCVTPPPPGDVFIAVPGGILLNDEGGGILAPE